ncbi:MAG TPA: efflux RND transporter periplasmic adaptor subunit [Oculatellaceae cyanobacterium]
MPLKTHTVIILAAGTLMLSSCSNRESLSQSSMAMQAADTRAQSVKTHKNEPTPDEFVLTAEMERRAGIEVVTAQSRQLSKSNVFSSSVEATSKGSAVVNSLVHGIITRVVADVGQAVKAGEILCYINCPDLLEAQSQYLTSQAKQQEAKAQLVQVENRVQLAKADIERISQLNKEGIAATKDLQASQARLATTEADLAAAKSLLSASNSYVAAAESRLKSFGIKAGTVRDNNLINELPLRSPISGTVAKRSVSPGQNVNPSASSGNMQANAEDGLFTILDLRKVWVMLEVPQSEVAALKIGVPVDFSSEVAPGKVFKGKVITPGEKFDPASRTVAVRVEIENPQLILKPGMLVLAHASESMTTGTVLTVPQSSVQEIDGVKCIFIRIGEHHYKKIPVKTGLTNSDYVQITKGLKAGEQVVTQGSFILKSEALKANLEAHD